MSYYVFSSGAREEERTRVLSDDPEKTSKKYAVG